MSSPNPPSHLGDARNLTAGHGLPVSFTLPSGPAPDFERLKIMVIGTPKAGNTWVRHLLATLYELPMVELNPDFHATHWASFGPRWIGQQHYHPSAELRARALHEGIVIITPLRHPGDILVSLRHHMQNHASSELVGPFHSMLLDPPDVYAEHTLRFVETGFFFMLHLSIQWLRGGWAYPVRYEDLWQFPLETLKTLTDYFQPVPSHRLRHAICSCEAHLMQSTFDAGRNFVRKGGIGSWMEELPDGIQAALRFNEPYPAQFAVLNYSMDASHPSNVRAREPAAVPNPLSNCSTFANEVPFAPILIRAYFDLPEHLMTRWPDAVSAGTDSFFAWLSQPAESDPHRNSAKPIITELARYLRSLRPDVAEAFPDPFGADRLEFAHWFLFNAIHEYKFDCCFTFAVIRSWAEGSKAPDKGDAQNHPGVPLSGEDVA